MMSKGIGAAVVLFISALALLASAATVRIEEWEAATPGSFPHDPAISPDGSLWYTGMRSNTLGRLDPKTGEIREFPLKTPGSGPHGLVADKAGAIWFTANYRGYIGRLDPRTGDVAEYPMPDRMAKDPHTPVFDARGFLWFTVQGSNFLGRLDPATGSILLKSPPTPDSRPYGIAVNSKGVPFFCEFGANKLGSIDPVSLKITEYLLTKGSRPRRLAIDSHDMVYYTDHRRGYLGRLDPASGKVEEWPSPGGRNAEPYGIAITPDGMVWYSETGSNPNMIVRFDPAAKQFQGWRVPSGGGVIRNMAVTAGGDIAIACSGVNKVGIVRVGR